MRGMTDDERTVLTPTEVARRFKVDPKTLARWADQGLLPYFRTPAGTRRYYADEIEQMAESRKQPKAAS